MTIKPATTHTAFTPCSSYRARAGNEVVSERKPRGKELRKQAYTGKWTQQKKNI